MTAFVALELFWSKPLESTCILNRWYFCSKWGAGVGVIVVIVGSGVTMVGVGVEGGFGSTNEVDAKKSMVSTRSISAKSHPAEAMKVPFSSSLTRLFITIDVPYNFCFRGD